MTSTFDNSGNLQSSTYEYSNGQVEEYINIPGGNVQINDNPVTDGDYTTNVQITESDLGSTEEFTIPQLPPDALPPDPAAPMAGSGDASVAADDTGAANAAISPLVLDLTGNGINLTPLSSTSPYFDLTDDGFARKTGWVGSGTGILCLVQNGNDDITNITQLFGTYGGYSNGFAALAALDSNGDGVIDQNDAAFADLRVWVDSNGPGTGQLLTLNQLGIVSINLKWPGLSRQRFGFDKGSLCRLVSVWAIAGSLRREGVARAE
jgi:hypothetical protein